MTTLLLTRDELAELTGYRQHRRQLRWLADRLRITAPTRADGLPVVSRAQVEAALSSPGTRAVTGPRWSQPA